MRAISEAMKSVPTAYVQYALDSITHAVEAGVIDDDKWLWEIFDAPASLAQFALDLTTHYKDFWLNERHRNAFMRLVSADDLLTYVTLADALLDAAEGHTYRPALNFPAPRLVVAHGKATKARK
jgi:hypothetical protein